MLKHERYWNSLRLYILFNRKTNVLAFRLSGYNCKLSSFFFKNKLYTLNLELRNVFLLFFSRPLKIILSVEILNEPFMNF